MAESVMTVAYNSGVNVFDTAEVYASGRYSANCRREVGEGWSHGSAVRLYSVVSMFTFAC